jgi:hypothetical protein
LEDGGDIPEHLYARIGLAALNLAQIGAMYMDKSRQSRLGELL